MHMSRVTIAKMGVGLVTLAALGAVASCWLCAESYLQHVSYVGVYCGTGHKAAGDALHRMTIVCALPCTVGAVVGWHLARVERLCVRFCRTALFGTVALSCFTYLYASGLLKDWLGL